MIAAISTSNESSVDTHLPASHELDADRVLEALRSSSDGLSQSEAEARLRQHGPNVLPHKKRITLAEIILQQFLSPLIYVLLFAAVVALLLQEYSDAGFIGLILLINAAMGAYQEWKAESNANALQKMIRIKVRLRRDHAEKEVAAEELVPGDIVLLESGNKVPADIRLIKATQVSVEEALLTGESLPVAKNTDTLEGEELPIGERSNMVFAGTTVITGRATGVVVSTGMHTEIGKIAASLHFLEPTKSPLVERMETFSKKISVITLFACGLIGVIGYWQGMKLEEVFFLAVAVAVSAIPEGLPIAMTVALSIGALRMAKRHVIIRKLTAVEGLGSCTFVATDKTGTLTVDQQTVKQVVLASGEAFTVTGEGYNSNGAILNAGQQPVKVGASPLLDELIEAITVCNESNLLGEKGQWQHQGDAVDVALLAASYKYGTSPDFRSREVELVDQIPFESERKYAAVYYRKGNALRIAVKGALEALLPSVQDASAARLLQLQEELAAGGYRVIAVAGGPVNQVSTRELPVLRLMGLVALIDPLRPEAKAAVQSCKEAGVEVAMITGDHPATALSIASELGIATDKQQLITGTELADISKNSTFQDFVETVNARRVFARVSPQQKQQIVETLKQSENFVAVTGDGVNDAPALKTANIGVAMGYGTDVAKETASIIITDNNFASIVAGIEEGRNTYSNLRKIIYLLISTGAAEILMVAMSLIFGLPIPFLPVQLLWLNLVTNGIQDVSLAFEKGETDLMKHPPRKPSESVFDQLMVRQTLVASGTMTLVTFGLWYHLLNNLGWDEFQARNEILLLMVMLQNFHVFNSRSETRSAFRIPLRNNYTLVLGVLAMQGLHIAVLHIPLMQDLLKVAPVSFEDWAKLLPTAAIILLVMEVFKYVHAHWKEKRLM